MTRRVRRKLHHPPKPKDGGDETPLPVPPKPERSDDDLDIIPCFPEWTSLPDDTVIHLFSLLSYRDRASLSSSCKTFHSLASSPSLWSSLDLRSHHFDLDTASSLSSRCHHLLSLRLRGGNSTNPRSSPTSLINLRSPLLAHLTADFFPNITDSTLTLIAARHPNLQSLQLGPDPCDKITSDAIRHVAMCCPKLKKLRLSGVREIDANAVESLGRFCGSIEEIAFTDCLNVEETGLGKIESLKLLSVEGCRNVKWATAAVEWSKLPNLVGVAVSRTDVSANAVSRMLSLSKSLKVMCAVNCLGLEIEGKHNPTGFDRKGKVLLAVFTDVLKGVQSLFPGWEVKGMDVFGEWRRLGTKEKNVCDLMTWVEWILCQSLVRVAETNPNGMDEFWLDQGAALLLSLVKSCQEDVQERAATGLANFVVIDDESATIDPGRAEAVMKNNGIPLLLELAKSDREGVQSEAAKAIANLSVNSKVAKAVADEGGIMVLADLARSMNKLVAEEAAGGLWNLSVGEEHKAAIAEAGGVKALVDLIFRWPSGTEGVLERAAGALANLAADDKCSVEVALAGGVHALVTLARSCKADGVQEQAARALANLAAHGDNNNNNAAIGQEAGALEALVQLTFSLNEGVRQEAAGALWNLSFDDRNREAIAAAGGVEALVALARVSSNSSQGLQERAAGALWGLSVSEANSIAIGREGGVAHLIALARSEAEAVHETAAGALWNLAFNSGNALRIVEDGGVPALVHLCSSSGSKMARFMAALALAYMFDRRMDEFALVGSSSHGASKSVSFDGARRMALKHIEVFVLSFSDPQIFSAAAASSTPVSLAQVVEAARIQEAGHLRCSGAEIGRFVAMLRNSSSILRACASFALLQFTIPGGRHATHHADLLETTMAARILRAAAASATAPIAAKLFARILLRNLEHHRREAASE